MKNKKLSEDEIKHLAKLANLKLSEEEIKKYSQQLSSILGYIDLLNEVNTDKVTSTASATNLTNVLREDEATDKQKIKDLKFLSLAEKKEKKYFKVKRIM